MNQDHENRRPHGDPSEKRDYPRENKPHDERRFDKKSGERRLEDRPKGERRFDGKPHGERRFDGDRPAKRDFRRDDRPYGERRFDDKPHGERRFDGDRPAKRDDRPHGERHFDDDRPAKRDFRRDDRPYGERRFDSKPHEGRSFDGDRADNRDFCRDERSHDERRFNDKPHGERRFDGDRPAKRDDRPHGERRFDDKPHGERRFDGDRPTKRDDRPHGERRFDGKPREDRRFGDAPHGEHRPEARSFGAPRGDRMRRPNRPAPQKSARDVALKALGDVVGNGAYAAQALDRALSEAKLSDEDRRLAASLFYFAIENRLQIEWALGKLLQTRPEPMVADILHIAAAQILFMDRIPDHAAVDEAVKQTRAAGRDGLSGMVNGVLRGLIRLRDEEGLALPGRDEQPEEYLSLKYSLALPAVKRLIAAYGVDEAERIAAFAPAERTQTVRPNAERLTDAQFEAMLDKEGLAWKHGTAAHAYVLSGAGDLSRLDGYRAGLFSIQGESSMLAAQAVEARPGMQLLDACAAPGGKTCLMAEQMGTSGRVYAWDVYPHRVELIRAAARRLSLENVRPAVHDARKGQPSLELAMDAVLVDAPCSGLGVIQDKPDIKYRLKEEDFESILPLQREILENCSHFVRVGGRLVYSTCTILPEENEAQVSAFLSRHPEFEPDTDDSWLPEALRGKSADGMLTILPHRDGMAGFFIARMRRRSM